MGAADEAVVPEALAVVHGMGRMALGEGLVEEGHLVQSLAREGDLGQGGAEVAVQRQIALGHGHAIHPAPVVIDDAEGLVEMQGIDLAVLHQLGEALHQFLPQALLPGWM